MTVFIFCAVFVVFINSSRSELARITLNNQATGNQVKGIKETRYLRYYYHKLF